MDLGSVLLMSISCSEVQAAAGEVWQSPAWELSTVKEYSLPFAGLHGISFLQRNGLHFVDGLANDDDDDDASLSLFTFFSLEYCFARFCHYRPTCSCSRS